MENYNNSNQLPQNPKAINPITIIIFVILIIGCIRIIIYFVNKNSTIDEATIDSVLKQEFDKAYKDATNKFYKGDDNWKFIQDPDDPKCLTNWNYYDTDKQTPIQKDISRITSIEKGSDWCATIDKTSPEQKKEPDYSYESEEDLIAMGTGLGIHIAGSIALSKLLKSAIYKTIQAKIAKKLGVSIFSKVAGRAISKTFQALSRSIFKPLLSKGFSKLALTSAMKMGAILGKSTAKIGASATGMLVKTMGKAGMKFATKFRPSPSILIDILIISLDIFDAGGYNKLQYKSSLYKAKKGYNDAFKTAVFEVYKKQIDEMNKENPAEPIKFTIEDLEWPMVVNPLDSIDENLYETFVSQEMDKILENPLHKHSMKFYVAIAEDIESGKIKQEDLSNEEIYDEYLDKYLDYDTIVDEIYANWCVKNNGLVYDKNKCTLPDNKCTVTWPMPLDENGESKEMYREFRDGKCVIVDPNVRKLCDEMNIPYDFKTGICKIDENYCKSKAAEWKYDAQLGEYDCKIPFEQKVAEFIFGTTVTRGLKQIFDAEQYENCGFDGEFKINGKCLDVSSNKIDENGTSVQIWDCNSSNGQKFYYNSKSNYIHPMANYNKCLTLNKENILEISDCQDSPDQHFYFDENTKQFQLLPDKTKCIQLINNNLENGTRFNIGDCSDNNSQKFSLKRNMINDISLTCEINKGRTADCPPTYTNNGLTCGRSADTKKASTGRVADCPPGYTNNGATCGRNAHTAFTDSGRVADCPPGYTNTGASCFRGAHMGESNVGRVADCPDGYTNNGATCGRGAKSFGNSGRVADCPPGYTNTGASCLRPAHTEFSDSGVVADCPSGYTNMGITCHNWWKAKSLSKDSMTCKDGRWRSGGRCYRHCSPGYTHTGVTCYRGPSTKGMDSMTCKDGEVKKAARCYNKCPDGYNLTLTTCFRPVSTKGMGSMTCKEGETKLGARCYKPCPEGYVRNGTNCFRNASTKGMSVMTCKEGEFKSGARCYKRCPVGYMHTGVSCFRNVSTLPMSSMTCKEGEFKGGARCYTPCPEGYTHTGVSCFKPASTKGLGSMSCLNKDGEVNKDERMIGGRCYPKCPPDYTNMGVHCTRRKYRKIAFSTKNN